MGFIIVFDNILFQIYHLPFSFVFIGIFIIVVFWSIVQRKVSKSIIIIGLIIAILMILYCTILTRTRWHREFELNPFYVLFEKELKPELVIGMIMNSVLFVPFGLFFSCLIKKYPIFMTVITSIIISTFIEIFQWIYGLGKAETIDIIMNTIGAFIGSLSTYINLKWLNSRVNSNL